MRYLQNPGFRSSRGFAQLKFETGVLIQIKSETGFLQHKLLKPGFCKTLF